MRSSLEALINEFPCPTAISQFQHMKYHFEMHSSQLKSISIYDLHEPKILNKGKAPVSLQYKAFEWVKRSSIQIFLGIVFIIKSFENVVLILFAIAYNFINYERNTINWNYKTNLFWIQIVSVCFRERIDFATSLFVSIPFISMIHPLWVPNVEWATCLLKSNLRKRSNKKRNDNRQLFRHSHFRTPKIRV